ncbi:DISARM system SNF2-like helicase DrmD [Anaerovibrio sp. RM50]|uniref:DISARM system SNF2-like helicase DrmD n=1 Tax=Anaerovibrio sp. RM50 TaxID=1200557 RepID=UPI000485F52D|nr:DISARM system SNF2-like helicase DrmD [Anaerovibrio sp. RM50]
MGIVEATYAGIKQQELTKNPYSCLSSADIDVNPHQVEAFLFSLAALKLGGAILADEVGLGKTIEAGLVLKFLLNSGTNKVLLITPSNLRKQWQVELDEKFGIESLIVDSSNWEEYRNYIETEKTVVITSYNFAAKRKMELSKVAWNFCLFDEAHRLRNIHKNGSKMANILFDLTSNVPKLLLTATPMQNSLWDLFGLIQFIDARIFYNKRVFSERYIKNEDYEDLRKRVIPVIQRTLRKEVSDYIKFPVRKEITVDFKLTLPEVQLYMRINNYLKKEILFALPNSHRILITSVIRKLLASSSMAVAETFRVLRKRLIVLKETTRAENVEESLNYFFSFFDDDEVEEEANQNNQEELYTRERVNEFIQHEIDEIDAIINTAESITKNAKMTALQTAVREAFKFQKKEEIAQKVVVFTESIRTQQYIYEELEKEGYKGDILKFNGSTSDETAKKLYRAWKVKNYGNHIFSRNVELKNAIVQAFKEDYKILLVTDSGSEGLNLQFCNTIINYDLPWNPQKIEQRIGRCHRYGQKNDVIVFNLLNTQNIADRRVYEILSQKFELFKGVFGASDRAISLLESGGDFEKRVSHIYQQCKTSNDFSREFNSLEKELDRKRNKKMEQLKALIIKEAPKQHKEDFERILSEIQEYQEQYKYWKSISINQEKVTYPKYYKIKHEISIPGIEHGYLIMGGYYKKSNLIQAVFYIVDSDGKIYAAKDELIRILMRKLDDSELDSAIPEKSKIIALINRVERYLDQEYINSNERLIKANDFRVDNWLSLRKEECVLSINDDSIINELTEKYENEKNFNTKIEYKKQIEQAKQEQALKEQSFHETFGELEAEANRIKEEFEKELYIIPKLFAKIVIRF